MTAAPKPSALERARAGETLCAVIQTIPSPALSELAVWCGYDLIVLDCEHGVLDEAAHLACMQVITQTEAACGVRVRPEDYAAVGRYLDWGADAILMADVKSAEGAVAFIAAATPGPKGTRSSTGSARARRYGLPGAPTRLAPLLLALIEGGGAVAAIDAIARTQGLDGLIVGPNDLSCDLGCPGDFSHADYTAAFTRVETAARDAGLIFGAPPHPNHAADRLVAGGARLIIAGADITAMREGLNKQLADARRVIDATR